MYFLLVKILHKQYKSQFFLQIFVFIIANKTTTALIKLLFFEKKNNKYRDRENI
jgi:hypothetical protein